MKKSVRNFDVESYHRGKIERFFLFFYGSGGRTRVLSHIYNPPKPSFDKEGLWQDFVLHCFAISIVASRSCKNRLEISIWYPTTTGETLLFLLFFVTGGPDVLSHIYGTPDPVELQRKNKKERH